MKIDLSCPVEVRTVEITVFDRGLPRAYVHLFNLAKSTVCAVEGLAHWQNESGEEEVLSFAASGMRVSARSNFTISLSPHNLEASSLEIEFTRVQMGPGEKNWIAEGDGWIDVPPSEPLGGREEAALVRLAGLGAVQYARLIPGAWICVCGRANALGDEQCARCMRGRETCLSRFTREAACYHLPPLPDTLAAMPPEPQLPFSFEKPRESVKKRRAKQRSKNRRFFLTVVLLLLAILLALLAGSVGRAPKAPEPAPAQVFARLSSIDERAET